MLYDADLHPSDYLSVTYNIINMYSSIKDIYKHLKETCSQSTDHLRMFVITTTTRILTYSDAVDVSPDLSCPKPEKQNPEKPN